MFGSSANVCFLLLLALVLAILNSGSKVSASTFSVPAVALITGQGSPDYYVRCLVRSEPYGALSNGTHTTLRRRCYYNIEEVPPAPISSYFRVLHVVNDTQYSSGTWTWTLSDCIHPFAGLPATSLKATFTLDKSGGTASGDTIRVIDSASPFTCTESGDDIGDIEMEPRTQNHDEDGDGCTDWEELGSNEAVGGLRDPFNPWDFYDVNGDKTVDLFSDIFGVALQFGKTTGQPGYSTVLDRGVALGPNTWNLPPPDGEIDLFNDVLGVAFQFGHSCV